MTLSEFSKEDAEKFEEKPQNTSDLPSLKRSGHVKMKGTKRSRGKKTKAALTPRDDLYYDEIPDPDNLRPE